MVYDALITLTSGRHELVLTRDKLMLIDVDVLGEFWSVKNFELNELCKGHPFLIDRTVTSQVNALETWELVLGVLINAERYFTC